MTKELPFYKLRVRELRDAVERLIDGDEPEKLFIARVRLTARLDRSAGGGEFPDHASIPFHRPAQRAHRLATADGRTSFHFSHRTVVRLRSGSFYDGVLLQPGAAREHCRYIERESAVASLALDPPSAASSLIANQSDLLQAYVETDNDLRPYAHHLAAANQPGVATGLYSADLSIAEARSAADGLRALPGLDVAHAGGQAARLLHGAEGRELERAISDRDGGMRRPADRADPVAQAPAGTRSGRGARSLAAGHLAYVERDAAVAIQPDGAAAIITNIAASSDVRLQFWNLVEQEESEPGPDRMTIEIERDPTFWARVARDEGCPADLREALDAPDPAARQKFIVSSGRDVRAFLSDIPGWQGRREREDGETSQDYRKGGAGLATFHDGRGGRVQYRIIGELPSELSMEGRMRALRRFARRFEELNMPYNLAVHAPDHGNSEHQWHFHLDYYDRPSWLLTEADIAAARANGLQPINGGVGEWSFAAKFRKNGKVSRPFRLDKVKARRAPDWIERLRERLAFVTNVELRREGHIARYDPRRYDQMGIKAEPGEHLGTKLNAAEGKGDLSERSVANEVKQWAAIEWQLEERRDAGNRQVSAVTAAREIRLAAVELSGAERAFLTGKIAELDALERSVIDIEREIATAQHLTARACSRASKIRQVNQRWLDAHEAGECDLAPRVRRERASLLAAAEDYLDRLEPLRVAANEIISACEISHGRSTVDKHALERLIEARLADAEARAARLPAWLAQLDQRRPIIIETREGYRLGGADDDAAMTHSIAAQQALKARYVRQERDVDALTGTIEKARTGLERRGGRWVFHHADPAEEGRFIALRDHPRVQQAIERIISPAGRTGAPISRSEASPRPDVSVHPLPDRLTVMPSPVASVASGAMPPVVPEPPSPATLVTSIPPTKTEPNLPPMEPAAPDLTTLVEARGASAGRSTPDNKEGPEPHVASRIDAMALALRTAKSDRRSTPPPASADDVAVGRAPRSEGPAVTAQGPGRVPSGRTTSPAAPVVSDKHTVQRIIAERIVLRLGMDGQIDAQALARQGIRIAETDRRDPRLLGKAREQRLHARKVVETFVTKYPGFIVQSGDLCSLSARTKPDVRAFFENHDDPWMQVMLRRVFDRHRAAQGVPPTERAVGPSPTATQGEGDPPSITPLTCDPAMIAAAQAQRERERQRAEAATRRAAGGTPAADGATGDQDGRTGAPQPPGPRRPPPGWDNGFGR